MFVFWFSYFLVFCLRPCKSILTEFWIRTLGFYFRLKSCLAYIYISSDEPLGNVQLHWHDTWTAPIRKRHWGKKEWVHTRKNRSLIKRTSIPIQRHELKIAIEISTGTIGREQLNMLSNTRSIHEPQCFWPFASALFQITWVTIPGGDPISANPFCGIACEHENQVC